MVKYKNRIFKIAISCIFFLLICTSSSFGYQILAEAQMKEDLKGDSYILYRKQVAAYYKELKKYNNNKDSTGWVYENVSDVNTNEYSYNNKNHGTKESFKEIYDYFHRDINSVYETENISNWGYMYMTGKLTVTDPPTVQKVSYSYVNPIMSETDQYSGLYYNKAMNNSKLASLRDLSVKNFNDDIVIFNKNQYRYAVLSNPNGTYTWVSDYYLSEKTSEEITEKFYDGEEEITIYESAVLRTNSAHGKYYQNMDTSFKFWETWVRGKLRYGGSSITGGTKGTNSAINYYDNPVTIPAKSSGTKIYVRHINATNMEVVNTTEVTDNNIMYLANTRAILYDDSGNITYKQGITNNVETQERYSEYYYRKEDEQLNLCIGNLKYKFIYSNNLISALDYNSATDAEKNIATYYKCLGAVVGTGNTLDDAIAARDNLLLDEDIRNQTNSKESNGAYFITTTSYPTGAKEYELSNDEYGENRTSFLDDLEKNDSASFSINKDDGTVPEYVVIDFYYEQPTIVLTKHVYGTSTEPAGDTLRRFWKLVSSVFNG